MGQDMNTRLTKYTRCTAAILAFAALASSRDFWWEVDNTDPGLYSPNLVELLAGGIGLVCLLAGALLLAMPNRKGFWAIYLSAIVTFAGLHFPGRAPLSYIPFLSFIKQPDIFLLAGNAVIIVVLVVLHVSMYRETKKRAPTNC